MTGRFVDRVILVTGAGSGIGRATARLFANEGGRVVVVDQNEADARATAALIELFLASDDASFIVGQALAVDGGLTAQLAALVWPRRLTRGAVPARRATIRQTGSGPHPGRI